ncbi:RAxF-45 family protein [Evansella halocellulosilytica]|uniref:RAxF-45 family protein n=1 Tax=Evansella halocellulosilytica TaxID=2011013 RepID=UPI0015CDDDFA|nr:RAxF-45 family protein [Evansella halocellulosilytica]
MTQSVFNLARSRFITYLYIVRAVFSGVAVQGTSVSFFSNFINVKTARTSLSQF